MQYINDGLKMIISCSIYFVKENIDDSFKNLASLVAESVSHNILIRNKSLGFHLLEKLFKDDHKLRVFRGLGFEFWVLDSRSGVLGLWFWGSRGFQGLGFGGVSGFQDRVQVPGSGFRVPGSG